MYNKYSQLDAAFQYMNENGRVGDDFYEFGVYKGESLKKICDYVKSLTNFKLSTPFVWGFDSFEGLEAEAEGMEVFEKFQKGAYKFDLTEDPIAYIKRKVDYKHSIIIKSRFANLKSLPLVPTMFPATLIHIDCDLFSATIEALDFMFMYNLIVPGTLIAYDEFRSTKELAGEERAHKVISSKYYVESDEVWHYTYKDRDNGQKIRQSVFEITKIG